MVRSVTDMLVAWNRGDGAALEEMLPFVEAELRRIAHNYMKKENLAHTLQTTALINEAYLKLVNQRAVDWQNRAHFFGISARLMRRILLNHARDSKRNKRGGGAQHVNFDDVHVLSPQRSEELIALDEALERLGELDETKSKIVELRYFGGLTVDETAKVMKLTPAAVNRHWRLAKAWLRNDLQR